MSRGGLETDLEEGGEKLIQRTLGQSQRASRRRRPGLGRVQTREGVSASSLVAPEGLTLRLSCKLSASQTTPQVFVVCSLVQESEES